MGFAPIALFVYNRPNHTEKTLEALSKNSIAASSILYIFCDGPKKNASIEDLEKIVHTRTIVKSKHWCGKVIIEEKNTNLGLSNSIISGVSKLVNQFGSVIILEDDILVGTGFLKYMNEALNMYQFNEKVGCIHAWNYSFSKFENPDSTFFLKGSDCWGWATWSRAWCLFESDGNILLDKIKQQKLEFDFDRRGTHKYVEMLEDQIKGKNDSWAIRFHASLYLAGKFCLHPTRSMVKNIGLDSSGTHCGDIDLFQEVVQNIDLVELPVIEKDWFFEEFISSYSNKNILKSVWEKLIKLLKRLFRLYL